MKRLIAAITIGLMLSNSAFAKASLPFIGTKNFSFGGVPAYHVVHELTIRKNGQIKLTETTCTSLSCTAATLYSGPFKSIIALKDEDGERYYIQLGKTHAKLLNKYKQQEYDCDAANARYGPCIAKYRSD